jgi:hypothetical protein
MIPSVGAATLTRTSPLPRRERSDATRPGEGGNAALSKVARRHSLQESA